MSLYPIFLKLEGHRVLIVGGGLIAEQKIEGILRSATDVTVIAPHTTPRIQLWAEQGRLKHVAEEYQPGMAQGYFLVIAATDSDPVNRAVYDEARLGRMRDLIRKTLPRTESRKELLHLLPLCKPQTNFNESKL